MDTAPRMRDALLEAIAEGEAVFVDLGSVTFMDSVGLSALIVARHAADARGLPLRLRNDGSQLKGQAQEGTPRPRQNRCGCPGQAR